MLGSGGALGEGQPECFARPSVRPSIKSSLKRGFTKHLQQHSCIYTGCFLFELHTTVSFFYFLVRNDDETPTASKARRSAQGGGGDVKEWREQRVPRCQLETIKARSFLLVSSASDETCCSQ